jgi:hypothetical protein
MISHGNSTTFLETGLQYLAKGEDAPQDDFVKMNSNIASGYNLPPDPGGEFYVNMTFPVRGVTIHTTCFIIILHFVHTGNSVFHRILTTNINCFSKPFSFVMVKK